MADRARCDGCGQEIDPLTCWCGDPVEAHGLYSGHGAVPMGCECCRMDTKQSSNHEQVMEGDLKSKLTICVKRTVPTGIFPVRASDGAAGWDLHAAENVAMDPGEWVGVRTGIALQIPQGWEAQIRPRSGMASRYGVTVLNTPGTIDADYRGELIVLLINHSKHRFHIATGNRIAQLVFARVPEVEWYEVTRLEESLRGAAGFGSTGV